MKQRRSLDFLDDDNVTLLTTRDDGTAIIPNFTWSDKQLCELGKAIVVALSDWEDDGFVCEIAKVACDYAGWNIETDEQPEGKDE